MAWTGTAEAAPRTAAQLYADGVALREAGDAAGACVKFITSARLEQAPDVVAEAAACREREGNLTEAVRLYGIAASLATDEARAAGWRRAGARIREGAGVLTLELGQLRPDGWYAISVDGAPVSWDGAPRVTLMLRPGPHTVQVSRPSCGHFTAQVVTVVGRGTPVQIDRIACIEDSALRFNNLNVPSRRARDVKRKNAIKVRERETRRRTHDPGTWMIFGGLGLSVAAGGLYYQSTRLSDKARQLGCPSLDNCNTDENRARIENSQTYSTAAKLSLAVGVGSFVLGLVLHKRASDKRASDDAVSVIPVDGGAMVGWGGAF